jgi:hypothetical protein
VLPALACGLLQVLEKIAVTGNMRLPKNCKYSLQTVACHHFWLADRQFLPPCADGSRPNERGTRGKRAGGYRLPSCAADPLKTVSTR